MNSTYLRHRWSVPAHVHAITTTRRGGISEGAYASFNLGDHVGDEARAVDENRARLRTTLPSEPRWLKQVHGIDIVNAAHAPAGATADGAWTDQAGVVCAILTADCLPVFLSDRGGTKIALLHAGWRGLVGGVIRAGVDALGVAGADVVAFLGPAIGPAVYEVGEEVRVEFLKRDAANAVCFKAHGSGHWWMDIYGLARAELRALGIVDVQGGDRCTFSESDMFYSHRRDGVSGRMASLLWLAEEGR